MFPSIPLDPVLLQEIRLDENGDMIYTVDIYSCYDRRGVWFYEVLSDIELG